MTIAEDPASRTVLIVEDEPLQQAALALALADAGFRVLTADTGEAAMEILRASAGLIDWLFTDIRLPGVIDGWRVADEFRFSHPLRPVIFATGCPAEAPRGVLDSLFLRKPYAPGEVVDALRRLEAEAAARASTTRRPERAATGRQDDVQAA